MNQEEITEELVQAAEYAAETGQLAREARDALRAPLADEFRELAAMQAELDEPVRLLGRLSAQVAEPLQTLAAMQAGLGEPSRLMSSLSEQLAEPFKALAAMQGDLVGALKIGTALEAQLGEPLRALAAMQGDLVGPLKIGTALQAQLGEPSRTLAAMHADVAKSFSVLTGLRETEARASLQAALGIISTAQRYAVTDVPASSPATAPTRAEPEEAASDNGATYVQVVDEAGLDTQRSFNYGALAIKLLWAWALIVPEAAAYLSQEEQSTLSMYIATISLALIITWRYNDTRKH